MELESERELIIAMNGKVDNLSDAITHLAKVLENIENVKMTALDNRITRLEKFANQWGGALIAFNIVLAVAGIIVAILEFKK